MFVARSRAKPKGLRAQENQFSCLIFGALGGALAYLMTSSKLTIVNVSDLCHEVVLRFLQSFLGAVSPDIMPCVLRRSCSEFSRQIL